jgi:general secretion pathway protein I
VDPFVKQQGMTLIEVMIAAAILALVMVAVMTVAGHTQRSAKTLLDKTHARWVVNNLDAELRAGLHGKITPTGSFQGNMTLGQQTWYWSAKGNALSEQVIGLEINVHESQNAPAVVTLNTAIWNES